MKYALGIAIVRDRASHTIALSQTALIDRIVEQFGQLDAHSIDTPMVPGIQIHQEKIHLLENGLKVLKMAF